MNLLQKFEKKAMAEVARPDDKFAKFNVGDTVVVGVKIADVGGFRTQSFEGVCISKTNKGLRSGFVVRRIGAAGEGITQTFMYYLSNIEFIKVSRHGSVRRAKLYYLANLKGKAARIKEKYVKPVKKDGK